MRGIAKSFGPAEVLSGVDFDLRAGEVHVLAGENGAGKSTLMKILAGVHTDYRGEITLRGERVRFSSPHEARERGIAVIYQELSLVGPLNVAENIFLGRERGPLVRRTGEALAAKRLLREMDIPVPPSAIVEELSLPIRQLIEITRALAQDAGILVMDEPTSSLTETEVETLFRAVKAATARGCGVIYISHKLEEIYRIADRITVLRDGSRVCTAPAAELPREELIRRMVGREIGAQLPWRAAAPGRELLTVKNLSRPARGTGNSSPLREISFTLHEGEVVGLAGLQGCGNSEVLQAVFGALEGVSGEILVQGTPAGPLSPARAIDRRVALQTNDRKATGLVMEMSVSANTTLAALRRFSPGGWLMHAREREAARDQGRALRLKAASPDQEVGSLSGGNQQKVVFAKWLLTDPRVLLLDDPTRGIDIGSKFEVYELIAALKERGCGIVMVSSELPELLGLSDRILVLREGAVVRELARQEFSQEEILRAALMSEVPAHA